MNEPTIFTKGAWSIRTVTLLNGEPGFVTRDVCAALEIGNVTDAMCRLDDDERGFDSIETLGGKQQVAFVTETGLYNLVLGSRKPEAKEFKRWVTHEVLPAIRKHGMYATPSTVEAMLNDPDTMIRTLTALKEERAAKELAHAQLAIAAPKVEFFDAVACSDDTLSIRDAAKVLNGGFGEKKMFAWLRGQNILMWDNKPYQKYVDAGYFRVIERQGWQDSEGQWHPTHQTRVTQRGLQYLQQRQARPS